MIKRFLFITLLIPFFIFSQTTEEDKDTLEDSLFGEDTVFGSQEEESEEEKSEESLEDSLFGEEDEESLFDTDMFTEAEESDSEETAGTDLLISEGVTWGGSFRGSVSSEWVWEDYWQKGILGKSNDTASLSPGVSTELFFDARPSADFRVYGELDIAGSAPQQFGGFGQLTAAADITEDDLPEGWSLQENEEGDTEVLDAQGDLFMVIEEEGEENDDEQDEEPETGSPLQFDISVYELFADFNYDEKLFFRFGKHTIKWGLGYFWSPADVLNLTAIDEENPQADREGPVSLKVNYPFSFHNLYLFIIANSGIKPTELAFAPKAEFLLGNTEMGISGYYQKALSPRGIITLSSTYGGVDFFTEGVVSLGSDRVFVRISKDQSTAQEDEDDGLETVLDTYVRSNPFFYFTTGFRYAGSIEADKGSIFVIGQYFYNGDGYGSSKLLEQAYYLWRNPSSNGLILPEEAQGIDYESPPDLSLGDLSPFGKHYLGTSFSWSDFLGTGLSFSALGFINMNDVSGVLIPSVSYTFFDRISLSGSLRVTFGNPGDEFTNPGALAAGNEAGPTFVFSLDASFSDRF